jgi:ABC-type transport system involved in cytochrome c biogenesis permease subunit
MNNENQQNMIVNENQGKLTWLNFPAFILMLAGAMAFGSLYSALLNKVGKDIEISGVLICLVMLIFIYAGYYSYNYLTFNKGNKIIALVMVVAVAALCILSFIGGKSSDQKWFALHEILNLVSSIVLVFIFIKEMMKK